MREVSISIQKSNTQEKIRGHGCNSIPRLLRAPRTCRVSAIGRRLFTEKKEVGYP